MSKRQRTVAQLLATIAVCVVIVLAATPRSGATSSMNLTSSTYIPLVTVSRASPSPSPSPSSSPSPSPSSTPAPSPVPGGPDLTINALEITQAIQTENNDVPLVANRPTVVRVYADTTDAAASNNVSVTISATRDGAALAGSPLTVGPKAVSTDPARGTYNSTFNTLLPSSWLSGNVTLNVTVDSTNSVGESNETNNTVSTNLTFNAVPALDLVIVPVRYTSPNGTTYPAPTQDTISDWIMRAYPLHQINVTIHAPIEFSGDLGKNADWVKVLGAVSLLRQSEVGLNSPKEYYGLISGSWFGSGIVGVGYVGHRVGASLDLGSKRQEMTGQVAGHEVGHNFGRGHAPCGVSGDASYPYSGGSIGQYGLDVSKSRVWSPNAPDKAKDVMSYCGPQWISDYTYKALYTDQRSEASVLEAAQQQGEGLLVRATFDGSTPTLQPVYALQGVTPTSGASSAYSVALLDTGGNVVATHPVPVYQTQPHAHAAESHEHTHQTEAAPIFQSISATVPRPDVEIARIQLLEQGRVVAERQVGGAIVGANAPTVEQSGQQLVIRWAPSSTPALVRYTVNDGASWTTLGVDVTGGVLTVDPTTIAGGTGRFEVLYADNVASNVVAASVVPGDPLPNRAPQAWITGPTELQAGQPLLLFGHGADVEDGVLNTLQWTVDGVPVTAGHTLQLAELAPGNHIISLTVRDSTGQRVQYEHRVTVTP